MLSRSQFLFPLRNNKFINIDVIIGFSLTVLSNWFISFDLTDIYSKFFIIMLLHDLKKILIYNEFL